MLEGRNFFLFGTGTDVDHATRSCDNTVRCPTRRGDAMGLLHLAVLGPPEVFHDGSRLTFSLRKALALLVYLAVAGGLHPRSNLAPFLWPHRVPPDAPPPFPNALALLPNLLA